MKNIHLILSITFTVLLLTGCTDWVTGGGNRETDRYFTGTQGVEMRFQPGSPPARFFYYLNDPTQNSFEVLVELKNEGASDAIGATYISGYDPNLVYFTGVDIDRRAISDCIFDFTSLMAQGNYQLFFSCAGVEGSFGGADRWNLRVQEIGELLGLDELEGWNSVSIGRSGDRWNLNIGWDNFGGINVMNHGRALAIVLSSLDWRNYNGFPFNGGLDKTGPGILRGDNYFYPGGDLGFQVFEGVVGHNWPQGLDETYINFMVTSCYGYTTYAAPEICIDPAPYDEVRKVCTPGRYNTGGSQGAPIAITGIVQENTPTKVFLTFTIRNVGTGRVFDLGYLERCSPYFPGRTDARHTDTVYIGDIRIGNQFLRCTPGYQIRLVNGAGSFTCEYDIEFATARSAYMTPVVVELWYGYEQSIQTSMRVKRVV